MKQNWENIYYNWKNQSLLLHDILDKSIINLKIKNQKSVIDVMCECDESYNYNMK